MEETMRAHSGWKTLAVNNLAVTMVDGTNSSLEPMTKASAIP
jgi:hypothetical protein